MDKEKMELMILGVSFAISEILPMIKGLQANGILHGLYLVLKAWKEKKPE